MHTHAHADTPSHTHSLSLSLPPTHAHTSRAYQVFNSKRDFSGKNVSKEFMIENASKSRVVLALISVNYFDSTWCCVEVTGASKAGTPVVPVYAGQTITGNACKKFIALKSVRREGCVACRLQLPRTVLWCATLCRPMPSPV